MTKNLPTRTLVSMACLYAAVPALQAQTTIPPVTEGAPSLQFRVGATYEHDSNVFRTQNKVADDVGTLSAGVRFDKQYSLQRIYLDAEVSDYRFRDQDNLNYTTLNYTAAWNFAFTPRLRGVLSADRRQYRDISDTIDGQNQSYRRTVRNETAEANFDIGGGWSTLAGITHNNSHSDAPRTFESSPDVTSARIGGGYEFPSGTRVQARLRRGDGSYDNLSSGSDFRETEPDVVVRWPVTAKTSVDGRVGWLKREHEAAPERDFSGMVGNVGVNWEITGKTRLSAGVLRELGAYEFTGGGNVRATRFFVEPSWKPTEKTQLRLRYGRDELDWRVRSAASPDAGRNDISHFTSAAFDWEVIRNITLTAGVRNERRRSNIPVFSYDATIVAVGAKVVF